MKKTNWTIALLVACIFLAFFMGSRLNRWLAAKAELQVAEDASILLEKIKSVTKLITVEGYFSEIYDYQDYYGYDLSIFRKKALIRVKAKVSVGYDLEKMKITSFPEKKTIVISEMPPPELLSIEHDLDYYDIQEGMFNAFSKDDYNKLNANAKDFIRQKAQESDLFDKADLQRNKMFEMIRLLVENAGWKLEISNPDGSPGKQ
ncbi:MAG TPA: DUF4230 domain-containing protein [Bacteroidetes bacterium]|nr:DUF4230 domain-containing protein [Bacteroidota bacterium]